MCGIYTKLLSAEADDDRCFNEAQCLASFRTVSIAVNMICSFDESEGLHAEHRLSWVGHFGSIDHRCLMAGHSFSASDNDFVLIDKRWKCSKVQTAKDAVYVDATLSAIGHAQFCAIFSRCWPGEERPAPSEGLAYIGALFSMVVAGCWPVEGISAAGIFRSKLLRFRPRPGIMCEGVIRQGRRDILEVELEQGSRIVGSNRERHIPCNVVCMQTRAVTLISKVPALPRTAYTMADTHEQTRYRLHITSAAVEKIPHRTSSGTAAVVVRQIRAPPVNIRSLFTRNNHAREESGLVRGGGRRHGGAHEARNISGRNYRAVAWIGKGGRPATSPPSPCQSPLHQGELRTNHVTRVASKSCQLIEPGADHRACALAATFPRTRQDGPLSKGLHEVASVRDSRGLRNYPHRANLCRCRTQSGCSKMHRRPMKKECSVYVDCAPEDEKRRNARAGGKRDITEKTHRPAASSGTTSTSENPRFEPGLPRWKAGSLTTTLPRPLEGLLIIAQLLSSRLAGFKVANEKVSAVSSSCADASTQFAAEIIAARNNKAVFWGMSRVSLNGGPKTLENLNQNGRIGNQTRDLPNSSTVVYQRDASLDLTRMFHKENPPTRTILSREHKLFVTGSIRDKQKTRRPTLRQDTCPTVAAYVLRSPKKSLLKRAPELAIPKTTETRSWIEIL
ncbi:hypothetical protein PR048_007194 [Dryococelus australis]|uniref:Uncharacterized protein n=1 Tax=Dryococelus australis TaxID=614101 RepID=A0ABQ9ICZ4_9NEOP|nr:hypothetical protein PR048_007194 [Dryococelus australis]